MDEMDRAPSKEYKDAHKQGLQRGAAMFGIDVMQNMTKIDRLKAEILSGGPSLAEMAEFVESIYPLSWPNVMRYAARNLIDNGDGTMTLRRSLPLRSTGITAQPEYLAEQAQHNAETRASLDAISHIGADQMTRPSGFKGYVIPVALRSQIESNANWSAPIKAEEKPIDIIPVEPDFDWVAQQIPRPAEIEGVNQVTGKRYHVVWCDDTQSYKPKIDIMAETRRMCE